MISRRSFLTRVTKGFAAAAVCVAMDWSGPLGVEALPEREAPAFPFKAIDTSGAPGSDWVFTPADDWIYTGTSASEIGAGNPWVVLKRADDMPNVAVPQIDLEIETRLL